MDPECWKMHQIEPRSNLLKHRKVLNGPKNMQMNYGRYLNTEREVMTNHGTMNEDLEKLEGTLRQVRADYGNGFPAEEQREMKKTYSEQSTLKMVNKCTVKKWAAWVPTFNKYGQDSKNSAKTVFGSEAKMLPIQVRDVGRSVRPQKDMTYAQLSREEIRMDPSDPADTKEHVSVLYQRAKVKSKRSSTTEAMLHGHEANHCEEPSLYLGIPFYHPRKRVVIQNNAPHQSRTSETWQRMKVTGPEPPIHTTDKVHQKIYDKHRLYHKDMPSESTAFTHNESSSAVGFRTGVNKSLNLHRDKSFRSSAPSPDKAKVEVTSAKQREKPVGTSTYRRFLLIDSQGLPYTVVVEEPKTTKTNSLTQESNSDGPHIGAAKSLAPRKVYTCPVCFRIFEYLSYLQRHSIAHSQQKPHICKICGKAFKRTSHLTRHKYTHFGGKPCQCQICHRRFRDAGELTRHQQIHTGERPHQCDVCHMRFGERSTLQRHILCRHVK
ncbi:uncharacterized protein LOC142497444 [Ascaphus truei]|uniref:uncharacterized protein LOC142497444 n=1 Tax=Ascaphus truei TaxID=8439 RepID=UPI003F59C979